MTQIIGNVLIIELKPEDKAVSMFEQVVFRCEQQVRENALLQRELNAIKETQQRIMSFAFPG